MWLRGLSLPSPLVRLNTPVTGGTLLPREPVLSELLLLYRLDKLKQNAMVPFTPLKQSAARSFSVNSFFNVIGPKGLLEQQRFLF